MDARTGHSVLIKAAAALVNQQFMPGDDPDDYRHQTMSTRKVARMMERPRDNLRGIAVNVRAGADAQAKEIARLRAAIQQTLEENGHLADGDNCTLHHLVRALDPPVGRERQVVPDMQRELVRSEFEYDAKQYGFDVARYECVASEPWSEYADHATGHRWAGWLAAIGLE